MHVFPVPVQQVYSMGCANNAYVSLLGGRTRCSRTLEEHICGRRAEGNEMCAAMRLPVAVTSDGDGATRTPMIIVRHASHAQLGQL